MSYVSKTTMSLFGTFEINKQEIDVSMFILIPLFDYILNLPKLYN